MVTGCCCCILHAASRLRTRDDVSARVIMLSRAFPLVTVLSHTGSHGGCNRSGMWRVAPRRPLDSRVQPL